VKRKAAPPPVVSVVEGTLDPEVKEKAVQLFGPQTIVVPPPINSIAFDVERKRFERITDEEIEEIIYKKFERKAAFKSSPYSPSGAI
jgi:hypothetical protein